MAWVLKRLTLERAGYCDQSDTVKVGDLIGEVTIRAENSNDEMRIDLRPDVAEVVAKAMERQLEAHLRIMGQGLAESRVAVQPTFIEVKTGAEE